MIKTRSVKWIFERLPVNTVLLRHGFPMPTADFQVMLDGVDTNRAFYLVHNSLPFHSGGYAVRTHGLLKGVSQTGLDILGVTRLGYPRDTRKEISPNDLSEEGEFDGVKYHRLLSEHYGLDKQYLNDYLHYNVQSLDRLVRRYRPFVLHGASNFINGATVNYLARKFHLRSIYEVRGLWEITRLSREPQYIRSKSFHQEVRMETEACLYADRVICITAALRDEVVSRGVRPDKITVVPNGVHTNLFVPKAPDVDLAAEIGLSYSDVVIGYVGSVADYEGLDDLLYALRILLDWGHFNVKLLIVGDGAALESCKKQSKRLGLGNNVIFVGRVSFDQVQRYYSLISIAPFPRKSWPVCEMVSPLKPFEAMAMEKCVLVSSVAALTEIVEHGRTGLVYTKGDSGSLAATLRQAIEDRDLRLELGRNARRWVVAHRDWKMLGARVAEIYDDLRVDYISTSRAKLSKG
jgi:glycosyltransferase involved in cell wall biosynthesis